MIVNGQVVTPMGGVVTRENFAVIFELDETVKEMKRLGIWAARIPAELFDDGERERFLQVCEDINLGGGRLAYNRLIYREDDPNGQPYPLIAFEEEECENPYVAYYSKQPNK